AWGLRGRGEPAAGASLPGTVESGGCTAEWRAAEPARSNGNAQPGPRQLSRPCRWRQWRLVERETRQGLAMSDVLTSPAALGRLGACDIIDWLVGDECHELDLSGLTAGFGARLRAAGVSLDR